MVIGDVVTSGVRNAYLRSEKPLLAVLGLEDVVIVATDDVVLAAPRDRVQEVRRLVDTLRSRNRPEVDWR